MKRTGKPRYFSSLTAKQKDDCINNLLKIRYNLYGMNDGLAMAIITPLIIDSGVPINIVLEVKGQRIFKHDGRWYPFNFKELVNNI